MKNTKKRVGFLLAALLLFMAVLSGCGGKKVTAEELIAETTKKMENVESMDMNIKMDISMGVKQSGVSMDLDIGADIDMQATEEPEASYMSGTLTMSMMGLSVDMESYSVIEDGKAVTYSGTGGEWTREETEVPEDEVTNMMDVFKEGMEYELQPKTEKVDGKEVYVLTGQVAGDLMNDMVGAMADSLGDTVGDIDWSSFKADITMKIDKSTKEPVEMIFDCSEGISKVMDSAMASAGADGSVSISKYVVTATYNSFNDVDEIVVPDEVKEAAVSSGGDDSLDSFLDGDVSGEGETEPDQEPVGGPEETVAPLVQNPDGTYTLKAYWGDGSANIAVPEGYEMSPYSDENYFSFDYTGNGDFDEVNVYYSLAADYTDEEMEEYYMDDIAYYQGEEEYSNIQAQEKKTVQVAGREVSYIKVSYTYDEDSNYIELNAWTFLENGTALQCEVEEYAYGEECKLLGDDPAVLEPLFAAVQ